MHSGNPEASHSLSFQKLIQIGLHGRRPPEQIPCLRRMNRIGHVEIIVLLTDRMERFIIPKVDDADLPFLLNSQKELYHFAVFFTVKSGPGVKQNRAVSSLFRIRNDIFYGACNRLCVKIRQLKASGNCAEGHMPGCIIGGQLADEGIRRNVRIDGFHARNI